jgi:hypothetical protein
VSSIKEVLFFKQIRPLKASFTTDRRDFFSSTGSSGHETKVKKKKQR